MLFSRTWEDGVYSPMHEDQRFASFLLDFCSGIKLDPKVRFRNRQCYFIQEELLSFKMWNKRL